MHFLFIFVIIILKPSSCFCQHERSFFIFCLKLQSFSTNCKKAEISIEVCKDMNHCILILICIYFAIFLTLVGVSFCKYFLKRIKKIWRGNRYLLNIISKNKQYSTIKHD